MISDKVYSLCITLICCFILFFFIFYKHIFYQASSPFTDRFTVCLICIPGPCVLPLVLSLQLMETNISSGSVEIDSGPLSLLGLNSLVSWAREDQKRRSKAKKWLSLYPHSAVLSPILYCSPRNVLGMQPIAEPRRKPSRWEEERPSRARRSFSSFICCEAAGEEAAHASSELK